MDNNYEYINSMVIPVDDIVLVWVLHVISVAVNNFKFCNIETESIDLHSFDLLCLSTADTVMLCEAVLLNKCCACEFNFLGVDG